MNDGPTILIDPGAPAPAPETGGPLTGTIGWAVLGVLLALGVWGALHGRRRRRIDPRESAFRRIAAAQGWTRAHVKALRREAAVRGLASPVGLALSPTLTARALEQGKARRR